MDDRHRHVQVRRLVDVGVAHTHAPGHGGHRRLGGDPPDQLGTAPRDDEVYVLLHLQHAANECAVGRFDELHGVRRYPGIDDAVPYEPGERRIRVDRLLPTAQYHGVAGLQAKRGDVDCHVRAALVYRTDDAQRDPTPADPQSVRHRALIEALAHGIGQLRDPPHIGRQRLQTLRVQKQPVQQRAGQPVLQPCLNVLFVAFENLRVPLDQGVGDAA